MNLKKISTLDREFSHKIRLPESRSGLRRAAAIFAHSADSWFWLAGLITLYPFVSPGARPLLVKLMVGIVITAVFVLSLKMTIKRPRPEGEWGQIYRNTDPHSFPSGHAARAIMLTLLIFLLGPAWLGGVMVLWTLLVNYARIALGVHYLSDILVGTAIGLLFGWGVYLIQI
ncbi:MAG: phosphatase PAP2 family protein [Anaerolineales bacterium]